MSNASVKRVAIIGGGLSGLSAAYRLLELSAEAQQPLEIVLFEAADRMGGLFGTKSINGYQVETGADSFITNKPWAVGLCRRLGLEDRLISTNQEYRRSLVLRKGRPVRVPEGFMLLSPAKVWPVFTSPIFSPLGKIRMGLEYLVPKKANSADDDESLGQFVRRRFGQEALDRLVQPMVGGIYTSDPEKLSLRATLPRFIEMEQQHRSLIRASKIKSRQQSEEQKQDSGARYSMFLTLKTGMSELLDALESALGKTCTIRKQTPVETVSPQEAGSDEDSNSWVVKLQNGQTEVFDAVVVTLPTYRAASLVEQFDGLLAESLNGIEYASSAIVVSGHQLSDIEDPLDAFGLVVPAIEKRNVLAVSFTSRKFVGRAPGGCVQIRTFIGGAMMPEMMDHSDEELIEIAKADLEPILRMKWNPDFTIVARYLKSMPQYHVGHEQRVAKIENLMQAHSGLELAGSAYHGVGVPDSIHSAEQAAEKIFQLL